VSRLKAGALALVVVAALAAGGAAAAVTPTPSQRAAIVQALRSEQGNVAIQKILISTTNPAYASMNWGFANGRLSAHNNSLLGRAGGAWKVLWARQAEQRADGACVYVPARVAHDLLHVTCPPASKLDARAATTAELARLEAGFLASRLTPYSKTSTGLTRACVSKLDPHWAGAVSSSPAGSRTFVWFKDGTRWLPVFESLVQAGSPPPPAVVLSLASCVGYNPADFGG
jgi:hypothetical protein